MSLCAVIEPAAYTRCGRWFRLVIGLVVALSAGGCEPAPDQADGTDTAETGVLAVELGAGTNLSLAVDEQREHIILALQGRLFRLPLEGGRAEPLVAGPFDAREPAIDPVNGDVIFQAYRSGTWDLWRAPIGGAAPSALTNDAFDDREPHVNLHGDVVFSSDREGSYDLWLLRSEDGGLSRLTSEPGNVHSPAFSPEGTHIAYAVDGTPGELCILDLLDGSRRTLVTEAGTIAGIAWSADGLRLSYQVLSRDAAGVPITRLRVIDYVDGPAADLAKAGTDVFPFRGAWLDDGSLLYAADGGIYRLAPDETEPAAIPFVARVELQRQPYAVRRRDHNDTTMRQALGIVAPGLSPDGETVAFTALGHLWLWTPATRALRQLTDDAAAEQTPLFLPDGRSLLYVTDRDGPQKIIVRNLQTGDEITVPVPGATSLSYPALSRDGLQLAVFRDSGGNPLAGQLVIVDLASGNQQPIGRPAPPQPVSFAPDGRRLLTSRLRPYSSRYREGVYELVFFDLTSGQETTVVPSPHKSLLDAVLAPDGRAVTYVQDGVLWQLELDAAGQPAAAAVQLTQELTDQPAQSADGKTMVYTSGGRLRRLDRRNGATSDITPPLPWTPDVAGERWVLRAGRLYDGRLDDYRTDIDIVIQGNRIETLEPVRRDRPERVVDAADKTVIPGLFEMHAHLGATSGRQGRVWLAWGITSVRDPGSHPYVARERKEAWDSGMRPGPRSTITGYLTDGNRVFYSMAEGITSEAHLERSLERARALEFDFIKTYVRLPDAWQARVVAFAHAQGIPVSSHELFPAVAIGMDHVEHMSGTSRRGYQTKVSALGRSYADVEELLVQGGMGITPTMVLPGFAVIAAEEPDLFTTPQFRTFYGDAAAAALRAVMPVTVDGARAISNANGDLLRRLVKRDALVVTGTDSPFVPYAAGLHAELRLYARAGLTPTQILHAATWKSAIAARVEHDLGSIEVGKVADLVVIDGDPLADIADADNVVLTVKGGRAWTQADLGVVPMPFAPGGQGDAGTAPAAAGEAVE